MERAAIELLARRAGLDKALAEFPKDVDSCVAEPTLKAPIPSSHQTG